MDKKEAKARAAKLRELIAKYRYEHHVLDRLSISEDALDSLKKELFDLEAEFPDLVTPDSPTQRVAGAPTKGFTKVRHPARMLSLNDAFNEEDLRDWKERLDGALGRPYAGGFYCDLKMDGLAIELRYEKGLLESASTRGDGETGDDVTQNVRTVEAVPLRLREDDRRAPDVLFVRGEVFLTKTEFARINRKLAKEGEEPHANPRNLAAGMIRKKDFAVAPGVRLSFYAYSVVGTDGAYGGAFASHAEEYGALREWGIPVNPNGKVAESVAGILKFHAAWEDKRDKLDYEFDGVVVSVNDNGVYRRAGVVGKAPRGALAFKFTARQAETVVEDIRVQVGRTGVLTPVAHLKPVHIGGTTVTRATLHNLDEVRRLGVKIGDTVIVGRAGDVIPDVIKVLPELRPKGAKEFRMPAKCPVCHGPIKKEEGKVAYACVNKECPARRRQDIYHFVSRNALDIDGVGPKIIDQLMDAGLIQDAADLFTLTADDLENLPRFAEVSSRKVIQAINERKTVPLHRFVYGLGIPNVGEETARDLAEKFHTLDRIAGAEKDELLEVPDVGDVVAESIVRWFAAPVHKRLLEKFTNAGVHVTAVRAVHGKLTGKSFVITGTLETMSREEAEAEVRGLGGKASGTVGKDTDYLVVGADPGGTKTKAAAKYRTTVLTESEFRKLLK
ncbi:MAG TPA: NAD-dependent DNA ligase LigA [Candidatus Paceibacterota bacterium]|nr:NAD-dependent DNA ligase LigA [Candidatus Paceibacterota bacterium]